MARIAIGSTTAPAPPPVSAAALATPLALVAAFLVATLPASVSPVDGGELSAVARHLGIAHPTGYPLWTPLARLVSLVPIGPTLPWRLALFSALCGVGALALLAPLLARGGRPRDLLAPSLLVLAASLSPFLFAARTAEVYALSLLFFALVLRVAHEAAEGRLAADRAILLGAYLLGLGSGVHMTLLLAAPALLYLAWRARPRRETIALALVLAALGRTIYAFLPIRSFCDPPLDWGNPVTARALFAHAFAWQYRVWMFESAEAATRNLSAFGAEAWRSFSLLLVLAPIGLARLARRDRPALVASLLLFGAYLGYAAGYSIHDIAIYFLPVHLVVVFWIGAGVRDLFERAGAREAPGPRSSLVPRSSPAPRSSRALAAALLPLLILAPAALSIRAHWNRERDEAALAESYARAALESLPPRAILISRFWDLLVSPAIYLQMVEGVRTDVTVLDQEHCRRSWHVPLLERVAPDLASAARDESAAFLALLEPFERGQPYDRARLQAAYERMIWAILGADLTRPVYATIDIEPGLVRPYRSDPHGLVMRLVRRAEEPPPPYDGPIPTWSPRLLAGAGEWGRMASGIAGDMAAAGADFALRLGAADLARRRLAEADALGRGATPRAQRVRAALGGD